jgi:hypothetical protein
VSFSLQKQLSFIVFDAICVMGVFAGLAPAKCSTVLNFQKNSVKESPVNRTIEAEGSKISLTGHHPSCDGFSSHILKLGDKNYCAGCAGLIIGSLLSLVGSIPFLLVDVRLGNVGSVIFWVGVVCVVCGLLQYNLRFRAGLLHLLLNVVLVFGAFLLLVGVNALNYNLFLNLYLLMLIVYWIMTRIFLSRIEHKSICNNCEIRSCQYSFS